MLSDFIRLLVILFDWRTWLRVITFQPRVDVLFISNIRSSVDRKRITGFFNSDAEHFGLIRMWLNGVCGHIRVINSTYEEILSTDGFRKAKRQALKAIEWGQKNGVKIVLFAASTKRLFGSDDKELKKMFPEMIFTIGDNGTSMMLQFEMTDFFEKMSLDFKDLTIGVLGANGFVGEAMVSFLKEKGCNVIGMGTSEGRLKKLETKYHVKISSTIEGMDKVDCVVACTHLAQAKLTVENMMAIRKDHQKLIIFDMAQPPNLDQSEYEKYKDLVLRFDSGDAFSVKLKYILGVIGYKTTGVDRGVTFGCFSEALMLANLIKSKKMLDDVYRMDYYSVNNQNIDKIRRMYEESNTKLVPQSPHCYGKKIKREDIKFFL